MEERRAQEVTIAVPGAQQPVGNVERMAPIGDGHAAEEADASIRQDPAHEGLLLRLDTRPHVGDELRDPMHR